jgi:hypothetical protein
MHHRRPLLIYSVVMHVPNFVAQAPSPAAALGLFDLEEFSFGAPPASYRDATPGLLMDRSLGTPATLQHVEVPTVSTPYLLTISTLCSSSQVLHEMNSIAKPVGGMLRSLCMTAHHCWPSVQQSMTTIAFCQGMA